MRRPISAGASTHRTRRYPSQDGFSDSFRRAISIEARGGGIIDESERAHPVKEGNDGPDLAGSRADRVHGEVLDRALIDMSKKVPSAGSHPMATWSPRPHG